MAKQDRYGFCELCYHYRTKADTFDRICVYDAKEDHIISEMDKCPKGRWCINEK